MLKIRGKVLAKLKTVPLKRSASRKWEDLCVPGSTVCQREHIAAQEACRYIKKTGISLIRLAQERNQHKDAELPASTSLLTIVVITSIICVDENKFA